MSAQPAADGFSNHVQDQLAQAAQQVTHQKRGHGRGRAHGRGRGNDYYPRGGYLPVNPSAHQGLPEQNAFPPLGSQNAPMSQASSRFDQGSSQQYRLQPAQNGSYNQPNPREFFDRTRGFPRGGRHQPNQPRANYSGSQYQRPMHDYTRPPVTNGSLYQPNTNQHIGSTEQQRQFRQRIMIQSDYLNNLQQQTRQQHQLKNSEKQTKEDFRKLLETLFQDALISNSPELKSADIRLKCYGSLNNGFGLAGCDMDLILILPEHLVPKKASTVKEQEASSTVKRQTIPTEVASADLSTQRPLDDLTKKITVNQAEEADVPESQEQFEAGRVLEARLLESGYGARLLTNTRVPILKICEKPTTELLGNLKENRIREDEKRLKAMPIKSNLGLPPIMSLSQIHAALLALEDQDLAADVAIPDQPAAPSLEFTGDCGIQCDVNFSNLVAMHNTQLLRTYCRYDERVEHIGVFVKTWAKTRDINTPYWGTLSSYGYVLLVLHYLMNVVNPPVIPNLQLLAREEDAQNKIQQQALFDEKYDIRFWSDDAKIANFRSRTQRNHESTGNLLRGFFAYYADANGFHWNHEVISLRSRGGILTKRFKGWTEAKWTGQNQHKTVRLRYLLAIEDPFEIDHNVGRTVGHNGIVAIRDEFRRAWSLIQKIGGEAPVDDLLEQVTDRGDTLRKDQDFHRQKVKQMKQELEAKELALKRQATNNTDTSQVVEHVQTVPDGSTALPMI